MGRLENSVYDTIRKYKKDAVVITGVIYDNNNIKYLLNLELKYQYHITKY
jgi:hypothetical protein